MIKNKYMPTSKILSLSRQLTAAGIEDSVVEELIKASYSLSLSKGDTFHPCSEDALIIYFRSGCMVEMLTLTDDHARASSVWTAGYITVSLPNDFNRFENQTSHYVCLFDAEITVIPESAVYRLADSSNSLLRYVLSRASEYLFTSRDMALLRSTLDKKENIILRLIVLYIRTEGTKLNLTIDEICLLTGSTRQYCADVIKQLQKDGIIEKKYGCIDIVDGEGLLKMVDGRVLQFLSQYMSLHKVR